jgi:GntR family transcriptional regulator/MocR family aminotransferase
MAMENPSYQRARHIFIGAGYSICDIPVGKNGMNLDKLSESECDLCYVTPSHQYPLGAVMPISARQRLLQWAGNKEGRYIIEDDHDSEYRYKGKPIPALQGIDAQGKVIYIGTFSKALAPAIRVGYMVLPTNLLPLFEQKCGFYSCTVSRVDQAILTQFISEGYFERHLNRMRKIYRNKHDTILRFMKDYNEISISGENTGLYLVFKLSSPEFEQNSVKQNELLEKEIIKKAATLGIRIEGMFPFYTTKPNSYVPTFLIGYGNINENEIEKVLTLLTRQVLLSL